LIISDIFSFYFAWIQEKNKEAFRTVLIAAAFCMFNWHVDGLASWTPTDPAAYEEMGKRIGEKGYVLPTQPILS
jgi:hypothetical protein